jgi:hypothetical protein
LLRLSGEEIDNRILQKLEILSCPENGLRRNSIAEKKQEIYCPKRDE